jgi:hypothetical protein
MHGSVLCAFIISAGSALLHALSLKSLGSGSLAR